LSCKFNHVIEVAIVFRSLFRIACRVIDLVSADHRNVQLRLFNGVLDCFNFAIRHWCGDIECCTSIRKQPKTTEALLGGKG
jgi:hypothetical protein